MTFRGILRGSSRSAGSAAVWTGREGMARQLIRPGGRRGRIGSGGLRRRLVVAFVLGATVSAGRPAGGAFPPGGPRPPGRAPSPPPAPRPEGAATPPPPAPPH